ncbi:hypothetical protein D3C87_1880630 [compost metagenome]
MQESDGQRQTPLHSAGILVHALAQMLLQVYHLHHISDPAGAVSASKSIQGREKLEIFFGAKLAV